MRPSLVPPLIAALSLFAAPVAVATPGHLVCTPAAFSACASVTITTDHELDANGDPLTVLVMTTHIYHGGIFYSSFGGPIFDVGSSGFPDNLRTWEFYTQGPVISPKGCPTGNYCDLTDAGWEAWPIDPNADPNDPATLRHHRYEQYPHVYACEPWATAAINALGAGLATCGSSGALVFRLTLTGTYTPNDVWFWMNNGGDCFDINGVVQPHYAYLPNATCKVVPGSVTPEPATWGLVATGLVGLGLAARRRRRFPRAR